MLLPKTLGDYYWVVPGCNGVVTTTMMIMMGLTMGMAMAMVMAMDSPMTL